MTDSPHNKPEITDLTDAMIKKFSTYALRNLADKYGLNEYTARVSVLSVSLTEEILTTGGTLEAIDELAQRIRLAYQDRNPITRNRYGTTMEIMVWADDAELRTALRYARDRAIKENQALHSVTNDE